MPDRLTSRFPVRQLLELFVLQSQYLGRLAHAMRSSQLSGGSPQRLRNRQFSGTRSPPIFKTSTQFLQSNWYGRVGRGIVSPPAQD
jgi:hypothetical protein